MSGLSRCAQRRASVQRAFLSTRSVRVVATHDGADRERWHRAWPHPGPRWPLRQRTQPAPKGATDLAPRIERCRNAATGAGRDPKGIHFSFTCVPVVGIDNKTYKATLAKAAHQYDREPSVLEERLARRGVPYGTSQQVQSRLSELVSLGITRIYLQTGTTEPNELEALVRPFL